MGKLGAKQRKAAENFIELGNKKQALEKAGYDPKNLEKSSFVEGFFERETVKDYIQKRVAKISFEKIADESEIMEYLTGILRGGITEDIIVNEKIISKGPSLRDRNKAAELLGRHYGLYKDKNRTNKTEPIEIKVDVDE